MGLWDRIKAIFSDAHEAFEYEEIERPRPRQEQRRVQFSSPNPQHTQGYSFTAPEEYQRLWNTRGLNREQKDLITHDRNFYNMYLTGYRNRRLSSYQRRNARNLLDDMLEDAELDIEDVFDYAAWRKDMGYDRRR